MMGITGYLLYFSYFKKDLILSKKGRDIVRGNIGLVRKGIWLALLSMLIYLLSESAEILRDLFPTRFDVVRLSRIHNQGEILHLAILIIGLMMMSFVVTRLGGEK